MRIKSLADEDFINYKKPSMFIAAPLCTFKCDKENGCNLCQNSHLAHETTIYYHTPALIRRYLDNPITSAIVCGGLEPFDTKEELLSLIQLLREVYNCEDDVVIYTGYTEEELQNDKTYKDICKFSNIIIKFGRFRPGQEPHYDQVLGVNLASDNQYAKRVSNERI